MTSEELKAIEDRAMEVGFRSNISSEAWMVLRDDFPKLITYIKELTELLADTPCDCTRGVLGYEHKGNCSRVIAFETIGKKMPSVEEEDQR